jgi:hypothetical protein
MKILTFLSLTIGAFSVFGGAANVIADGLENGDFSHGKSKWLGEGQIVFLSPDGTISATDP